jgi:hypothetical protein
MKKIAKLLKADFNESSDLASIAAMLAGKGRGNDTLLAHITPKEAEDLKKQTNEATVEGKGEGIGAGAGTAIGGTLGAIAGSFIGGPVGTIAGGYLGAKAGEFVGGKVGKLGGQVVNYFSGDKKPPVDSAAPIASATNNNIIDTSTDPKEIEKALISTYPAKMQKDINIVNDVREEASIQAKVNSAKTGSDVSKTSTENNDMEREASKGTGGNNTVVSNNVSSNNTTKYVPMKASPRPESQGSALDRYQNRITVY